MPSYREVCPEKLSDACKSHAVVVVLHDAAAQEPDPLLPHTCRRLLDIVEQLAGLAALQVANGIAGDVQRLLPAQGVKDNEDCHDSEDDDDPAVKGEQGSASRVTAGWSRTLCPTHPDSASEPRAILPPYLLDLAQTPPTSALWPTSRKGRGPCHTEGVMFCSDFLEASGGEHHLAACCFHPDKIWGFIRIRCHWEASPQP